QRVSAVAATNRPASSHGGSAGTVISGGSARTDHSTHRPSQAVCSTATAGGSTRSSIQFQRFKFGPVLGNVVGGNFRRQAGAGQARHLVDDHQGHRVAGIAQGQQRRENV